MEQQFKNIRMYSTNPLICISVDDLNWEMELRLDTDGWQIAGYGVRNHEDLIIFEKFG